MHEEACKIRLIYNIPKIDMFFAYLGMFFPRRGGGGHHQTFICKNRPRVAAEIPVPPWFVHSASPVKCVMHVMSKANFEGKRHPDNQHQADSSTYTSLS